MNHASATMETPSKHHYHYSPVIDTQYQTKDGCTLLPDRLSLSTLSVCVCVCAQSTCVFLEGAIPSNIQRCGNNFFD